MIRSDLVALCQTIQRFYRGRVRDLYRCLDSVDRTQDGREPVDPLDDLLHVTPEAIEQARATCNDFLQEHGEATMSQLRDAWGISRKFSVPLCEYLDSVGVTIRKGDVRIAGPNIAAQ